MGQRSCHCFSNISVIHSLGDIDRWNGNHHKRGVCCSEGSGDTRWMLCFLIINPCWSDNPWCTQATSNLEGFMGRVLTLNDGLDHIGQRVGILCCCWIRRFWVFETSCIESNWDNAEVWSRKNEQSLCAHILAVGTDRFAPGSALSYPQPCRDAKRTPVHLTVHLPNNEFWLHYLGHIMINRVRETYKLSHTSWNVVLHTISHPRTAVAGKHQNVIEDVMAVQPIVCREMGLLVRRSGNWECTDIIPVAMIPIPHILNYILDVNQRHGGRSFKRVGS